MGGGPCSQSGIEKKPRAYQRATLPFFFLSSTQMDTPVASPARRLLVAVEIVVHSEQYRLTGPTKEQRCRSSRYRNLNLECLVWIALRCEDPGSQTPDKHSATMFPPTEDGAAQTNECKGSSPEGIVHRHPQMMVMSKLQTTLWRSSFGIQPGGGSRVGSRASTGPTSATGDSAEF